jgi:hypothetical protein
MELWLVLLLVAAFGSAVAVLVLAWRSRTRFTSVQVALSATVATLILQFWFAPSGTPSFLMPFEWFVFEVGGTVVFWFALLGSLTLASANAPGTIARRGAIVATIAGILAGGFVNSLLFFGLPDRLWKNGIGVPGAIPRGLVRVMQDWQQFPSTAPWAGIVPGQRLESFSAPVLEGPLGYGNQSVRKGALSFAPSFRWEFSVQAKYAAKRALTLRFLVFSPDKIVWVGVEYTPDTPFDSIPRTQAVLQEWHKHPRRAPWGWALKQMDGLEDTSEALIWTDGYVPQGLRIKLGDGTRIEWLRHHWSERLYRLENDDSFCRTPLGFLGLCW